MYALLRTTEQTGIVLPGSDWKFEFATVDANSGSNIYEAINHHNREILKNVLAQFLDLGADSTGSYALSEDQSSLFLLSISALAKQIAYVINKYLIRELVDLNYITDTYPELIFNKIGDVDYKKMADTLKALVESQVITPDEELEKFVRDSVGLPPKMEDEEEEEDNSTDMPQDTPEEDTGESDAGDTEDITGEQGVEAHEHEETNEYKELSALLTNERILELQNNFSSLEREELKKKGVVFNDYESQAWRPLTFAERRVNWTQIKDKMEKMAAQIQREVSTITQDQITDLLAQVSRAVDNNDLHKLENIKTKYVPALAAIITAVQKDLFEYGKRTASSEMGVNTPTTAREVQGALRLQNDVIAQDIAQSLENEAKKVALQEIQKNAGSITKTGVASVMASVGLALESLRKKKENAVVTTSVINPLNLGRISVFDREPQKIYAYEYSAIIDQKTSDLCLSLDGRVVQQGSREYATYSPPQHYSCRSVWVAVMNDDAFKPKIGGIPSSIPATTSFDNMEKLKAPVIQKGSPAVKVIQQEIDERQNKLTMLQKEGKFPNRQDQHTKRINELEKSIRGKFTEYLRGSLRNV